MLRHEIICFHCNFQPHKSTLLKTEKFLRKSGTLGKLAQSEQMLLRKLLGNQFDRITAIDFHVSHTVLDQVIEHIYRHVTKGGGGKAPLNTLSP